LNHDFGQYADSIQGARVTFLKSAPSSQRWGVRPLPLNQTIIQFGADGGPGITHGVTDPNFTSLIIQTTGFDDRVMLDGTPCQALDLIILPPDCHFTFVRYGHVEWVAWSMPREENIARKIIPAATIQDTFKTAKHVARLPGPIASRLIAASKRTLRSLSDCDPAERPALAREMEGGLMNELAHIWDSRQSETVLPNKYTISSERVVLRALEYVRARSDSVIYIEEIVRATKVEYRTLLRSFERYLGFSPKHYLMLRQINLVYHAIRRERSGSAKIADILSANGVNEFGRFAGYYKSIFGELPSETHHRLRLRTVSSL